MKSIFLLALGPFFACQSEAPNESPIIRTPDSAQVNRPLIHENEVIHLIADSAGGGQGNLEEPKSQNSSLPGQNQGAVRQKTPVVKQVFEEKKAETDILENKVPAVVPEAEKKITEPSPIPIEIAGPKHDLWDDLLKKYVQQDGRVNYKGLQNEKGRIQEYLELLSSNPPENTWTRNEKLAFWLNAYNAFTIHLVLKNYPLQSIRDLDNGNPWGVKWIEIGGRKYSLDQIENEIIRPQFKEPRIHFALNCAAKSCPPLLPAAFFPGKLEQQLENQTRKFVNNPAFNDLKGHEIRVSKIFDWYAADFGSLGQFLNKYYAGTLAKDPEIRFFEYDWSLNE